MQKFFSEGLFAYIVPRKSFFIRIFWIIYILQILFIISESWVYFEKKEYVPVFYNLSINSGRLAVIFFIFTLVPGMTKRFGIRHKLLALFMIFRRYIGILMYLFALIHATMTRFLPTIAAGRIRTPPLFELMGFAALFLLFFLFITSNDFSVRVLGVIWYFIHKLIYLAMLFILLHVGLQRMSIWTVLMGATVFLMVVSFGYQWVKKRKSK